jgi:hypothetical protein
LAANSLLVLLLACRDSRDTSGTTGNTASAGGTSATTASSVGDTATGDTESPQGSSTDAGARRSGMTVHLANVRLGGALPTGPDPATDALDVQWDLEIAHFGGEDLVDIRVSDARLVLGNGWSIEFTPESAAFDGRVAAGSTRSIPFHKRPETASPRATHDLCGQWMRLEMVVALGQTGRSSRVQSRSIRVICPDTPTGARPAP